MAQQKKLFTIDQAVKFVLEPASDSETSDIEDEDDDEYIPEIEERLIIEEDEFEEDETSNNQAENDDQTAEKSVNEGQNKNSDSGEEEHMQTKKSVKRVYRWRKKEPALFDTSVKGGKFSPPPPNAENMTPFQYFQRFWDNEIRKYLTEQTNLYSMQETGKSINVTGDEIEVFFGIQMTMAIVRMSQYEMYWSPEFRYDKIRSAMTLKRYQLIRRFIHANDNTKKTNPENVNDKLFKVRPLLDLVRNNCIKVEPEQCHSIDEQIIPAKTKRSSGGKQYNPKKIR